MVNFIKFVDVKYIERAITEQYEFSTNSIIDKITISNNTDISVTFDLWLCPYGTTTSNAETHLVNSLVILPKTTYFFYELIGHIITPSSIIYTNCDISDTLILQITGREI